MSKSIGNMFGTGSTGMYGFERNYINYLRNYDTSNYDNTLNNMTANALALSNNLSSMPGYQFSVDGSDAARQRAENATYQSYLSKLLPQHQQQANSLQNSLVNQGIPVGSAAYNQAMTNMYNSQNDALNEAAYNSVTAGQDAFSQAYRNNLQGAQFANNAQQNYINMIKSLLEGSVSGYQKEADLYGVQSGVQARRDAARQARWDNVLNTAKTAASVFSPQQY